MQTETLVYEQTADDAKELIVGKVTHDEEDEMPFYVELHEDWMSEKNVTVLIKTLQKMKRIRKTGGVR